MSSIVRWIAASALGASAGCSTLNLDAVPHSSVEAARGRVDVLIREGDELLWEGDLAGAEEAFVRVGEIGREIGDPFIEALSYGNLSWTYQRYGDLDRARTYMEKALEISEDLKWKNGIARAYGSLGVIRDLQGEWGQAEIYLRKALEIEEDLGRRERVASVSGNLGALYLSDGYVAPASTYLLDLAEAYLLKSLTIHEELGRKEGIANNLWNLGLVYQRVEHLDRARAAWARSRNLYLEVGDTSSADKVQSLLDMLPE